MQSYGDTFGGQAVKKNKPSKNGKGFNDSFEADSDFDRSNGDLA